MEPVRYAIVLVVDAVKLPLDGQGADFQIVADHRGSARHLQPALVEWLHHQRPVASKNEMPVGDDGIGVD